MDYMNPFLFGVVRYQAGVEPHKPRPGAWQKALDTLKDLMYVMEPWPTAVNQEEEDPRVPEKTYYPEHSEYWTKEGYLPFPETGLEHCLLFMLVARKAAESEATDERLVQMALKTTPDEDIYNEELESRHYLPKEIEELPESKRPEAVLKLLHEIESSTPYLKDLDQLRKLYSELLKTAY